MPRGTSLVAKWRGKSSALLRDDPVSSFVTSADLVIGTRRRLYSFHDERLGKYSIGRSGALFSAVGNRLDRNGATVGCVDRASAETLVGRHSSGPSTEKRNFDAARAFVCSRELPG